MPAVVDFLTKNDLYTERAQGNGGPDLYMIGTDGGVYLVAVHNGDVHVLGMAPNSKKSPPAPNAATVPRGRPAPPNPPQNLYPPPPSPHYRPNPPSNPPRQPVKPRNIVVDLNNPLIDVCPHCDNNTQSIVEHRSGWVFWGWCCCLLVTMPPLVCVPLCVDKCKDQDVFCAECGHLKKEVKGKCC